MNSVIRSQRPELSEEMIEKDFTQASHLPVVEINAHFKVRPGFW
jgi:hypothetical protein